MLRNSLSGETDEELFRLVNQGKRTAFDELYRRYGQKMFGYFFRMLYKDEEKAADFTQDLFAKLFQTAASFAEGRSVKTWIYSIANNMCKNEYRKQAVRSRQYLHDRQEVEEPLTPDLKKFREILTHCVNGLAEEKRTLFILRFQDELSVAEISRVMAVSEGTIKSRIFYLMKEVKVMLKDFETLITYP